MKGIYSLNIDYGRSGELKGVFIADSKKVEVLLREKIVVYWGEVLGKHSEVYAALKPEQIQLVSDNQDLIRIFEDYNLAIGYDPFEQTALNFEYEGIEEGNWVIDELCDKIIELTGESDKFISKTLPIAWEVKEMVAYRTKDKDNDIWSEDVILLKDNDEAMEFFVEDNPVLLDKFTDENSRVLRDFEVQNVNHIVNFISFNTDYSGEVKLYNMSSGLVVNKSLS